jgi:hypothetical protein
MHSRETVVISTAVALGGAHLGPLLIGGEVEGPFYLLQSLYIVWSGLLLGEFRRGTDSWAGHATYNVTVLLLLTTWRSVSPAWCTRSSSDVVIRHSAGLLHCGKSPQCSLRRPASSTACPEIMPAMILASL